MEEITLEKIDIIRERIGVSYKEAKEILERNNGNVIEALVDAENTTQSNSWTEEFSVRSNEVMDRVKELIREGNVNRIRIKHDGRTLVEIPVALGAIGAVVLPQLAALGVLVAVFKRCTIEVVRTGEENETPDDNRENDARDEHNNPL
ncbi:DUF4342 domain-containing protein|uniref:DUF4342 domain-containing protein n=1 Tax=Dendrosporobacter quercicolus TaxID=146817 RepID=A0A1G9MPU5_9FIRM|nr:DUF4342 domain-containing protein [Dendrosporobacter quercicolus]NSL47104.1 DUF4342 domain-containing protein [Dendrosporobacter quercicolus DSM 1736]SDL76288.1 protein of unknown function [Dendrosporobacter quercicolus]